MSRIGWCVLLILLGALAPTQGADATPLAIGSWVSNLTFKDIRYVNRSLDDFPKAKAFALVFVDAGCPLAQRYLPTLEKMAADYRDRGIVLIAVDSGAADTITRRRGVGRAA